MRAFAMLSVPQSCQLTKQGNSAAFSFATSSVLRLSSPMMGGGVDLKHKNDASNFSQLQHFFQQRQTKGY